MNINGRRLTKEVRAQVRKNIAMSVIRMDIRKYYGADNYGKSIDDLDRYLKNTLDYECLEVWEELEENYRITIANKIYREFNTDSIEISPYHNIKYALDRYYSRNTLNSITIEEVKDYYYNSLEEMRYSPLSETDLYGSLLIADHNNNHYYTEEEIKKDLELEIYKTSLTKHKENREIQKYLFGVSNTGLEEDLKEELNYNNYILWEKLEEEEKYRLCNQSFKRFNKIDLPK